METVISENQNEVTRAILAVVMTPDRDENEVAVSLHELERLLETAGGELFAEVVQARQNPDNATYLGKGKIEEIGRTCKANDIHLVICDDELSPAQIKNMEDALADAIEHLLAPLKYIKVPVHDFAMMITIAMRFIPILIEETDKIMSAQASRGADFKNGSLIKRAKALIPVFIPLFISSVRHADNLATAMECRCYHGGKGRTRMNRLRYQSFDFAALLVMALFLTGVAVASVELSSSLIGMLGFVYA